MPALEYSITKNPSNNSILFRLVFWGFLYLEKQDIIVISCFDRFSVFLYLFLYMDDEVRRLYEERAAVGKGEIDRDIDRLIDCTFGVDVSVSVDVQS